MYIYRARHLLLNTNNARCDAMWKFQSVFSHFMFGFSLTISLKYTYKYTFLLGDSSSLQCFELLYAWFMRCVSYYQLLTPARFDDFLSDIEKKLMNEWMNVRGEQIIFFHVSLKMCLRSMFEQSMWEDEGGEGPAHAKIITQQMSTS